MRVDDDRHTIFVHLSVAVATAGMDMIENIGMLRGLNRANGDFKPWQLDDLRKAIKKASAAIAAYDECTAAGVATPTNDEWRATMAASDPAKSEAA